MSHHDYQQPIVLPLLGTGLLQEVGLGHSTTAQCGETSWLSKVLNSSDVQVSSRFHCRD